MWRYEKIYTEKGMKYIAVNTCESCGNDFSAERPSSTRYCEECGLIIKKEKNRLRAEKYRQNKKSNQSKQ